MSISLYPSIVIDHIIFDWDGTLVDTVSFIKSAHSYVFKNMGYSEWNDKMAEKYMKFSSKTLYPKMFGADYKRAFLLLDQFIKKDHLERLDVFDGSLELIRLLNDLNIPMSVISNKKHEYLIDEVGFSGLGRFFEPILGAGYFDFDKPNVKFREYYIEKSIIDDGDNILVIGDSSTDFDLAQNCGFMFLPIGCNDWIMEYRSNLTNKDKFFYGFSDIYSLKLYLSENI